MTTTLIGPRWFVCLRGCQPDHIDPTCVLHNPVYPDPVFGPGDGHCVRDRSTGEWVAESSCPFHGRRTGRWPGTWRWEPSLGQWVRRMGRPIVDPYWNPELVGPREQRVMRVEESGYEPEPAGRWAS